MLTAYPCFFGSYPLTARMKPRVDIHNLAVIDMRIDLRGGDVGMAEHLLDRADLGAMRQQMRGKAVAQHVR